MSFFCCSSTLNSVYDPIPIDISNASLLDRLIENALESNNKNSIVEEPPIFERDVEPLLSKESDAKDIVETVVEEIIDEVVDAAVEPTLPQVETSEEIAENKI
jgi:hypothetical protein